MSQKKSVATQNATPPSVEEEIASLKKQIEQLTGLLKASAASPAPASGSKKAVKAVPKDVGKLDTKAAKMRALARKGWSIGDIHRALGVQYQHVYNTLNRKTKDWDPGSLK